MQIEFNYWYEAWLRNWQESLAYAFKKMRAQFEYDEWWNYGS